MLHLRRRVDGQAGQKDQVNVTSPMHEGRHRVLSICSSTGLALVPQPPPCLPLHPLPLLPNRQSPRVHAVYGPDAKVIHPFLAVVRKRGRPEEGEQGREGSRKKRWQCDMEKEEKRGGRADIPENLIKTRRRDASLNRPPSPPFPLVDQTTAAAAGKMHRA